MNRRITGRHALIGAAAVCCLLVAPIAVAGSVGGPEATASGVKKQIEKLKKRVKALENQGQVPGPKGDKGDKGDPGPSSGPAVFANAVVDLDFFTTAAGVCGQFAINVPGNVLATDEVIVTPPETQPEGLIVQAKTRDGAVDNVLVQHCAVEAFADPPNAGYEFTIIR
jgi:hypothetical protein